MSKGPGRVQRLWLQGFADLLEREGRPSINRRDADLTRFHCSLADKLAEENGRLAEWKAEWDANPLDKWTWKGYYRAMHRPGVLLSVYHAKRRLIEAGYVKRVWSGWLEEPPKWNSRMTQEVWMDYDDKKYKRRDERPGYYYSLTDKGRAWVQANKVTP